MSAKRWFSRAPIALGACLAVSSLFGQATRTWVSGVGDDANPCSRTAPCKTFAGAIAKTAAGGEIDVLDPGGFGALTITKAISIEADGLIAGVLVSGTNGFTVSAGASDVVVLRGITFEGLGTGINGVQVNTAGTVIIENCYFKGFATRGISIQPTSSSGSPTKVFIYNTQVQGNTSNGLVVAPGTGATAQVSIENTNVVDNTNIGLAVSGAGNVTIRNSTVAGNGLGTTFSNIRIDGTSGATLDMDKVMVASSPIGIYAQNSATVRVNNSTIVNNTTAVSTASSALVQSYGNNRITNGAFSGMIGLQ